MNNTNGIAIQQTDKGHGSWKSIHRFHWMNLWKAVRKDGEWEGVQKRIDNRLLVRIEDSKLCWRKKMNELRGSITILLYYEWC